MEEPHQDPEENKGTTPTAKMSGPVTSSRGEGGGVLVWCNPTPLLPHPINMLVATRMTYG